MTKSIPVPDAAASQLRDLYSAYERAKKDLALYMNGVMAGMGLSGDWCLDTDTMMMEMASPDIHPLAPQRSSDILSPTVVSNGTENQR